MAEIDCLKKLPSGRVVHETEQWRELKLKANDKGDVQFNMYNLLSNLFAGLCSD